MRAPGVRSRGDDPMMQRQRDLKAGLNTGGFSGSELREAGADEVYPTPLELLEALDGTPLSGV